MSKKPEANPLSDRIKKVVSRPPVVHAEAQDPNREAPRQSAFRQAVVKTDAGERYDVVVKNFSATGAKIESFRHFHLPDSVELDDPVKRIKRRARVVWQERNEAALEFLD